MFLALIVWEVERERPDVWKKNQRKGKEKKEMEKKRAARKP